MFTIVIVCLQWATCLKNMYYKIKYKEFTKEQSCEIVLCSEGNVVGFISPFGSFIKSQVEQQIWWPRFYWEEFVYEPKEFATMLFRWVQFYFFAKDSGVCRKTGVWIYRSSDVGPLLSRTSFNIKSPYFQIFRTEIFS